MNLAGHDPGNSGSFAVVTPGRSVLYWAAWSPVKAGYRLRTSLGEVVLPNLHAIGVFVLRDVRELGPFRMSVEGLFEPKRGRGKSIKAGSAVKCAEACGEFMGPMQSLAAGEILRPPSDGKDGWRKKVLGLVRVNAKAAEGYAVDYVERHYSLPERNPVGRNRTVKATLSEEGSICESVCIAESGRDT